MPGNSTSLSRLISLLIVSAAIVAGAILMARGSSHGILLVLSGGVLGALYARWVLGWCPSNTHDGEEAREGAPDER
jgi:hypothetical protein